MLAVARAALLGGLQGLVWPVKERMLPEGKSFSPVESTTRIYF
jgi:hypothetical protein